VIPQTLDCGESEGNAESRLDFEESSESSEEEDFENVPKWNNTEPAQIVSGHYDARRIHKNKTLPIFNMSAKSCWCNNMFKIFKKRNEFRFHFSLSVH